MKHVIGCADTETGEFYNQEADGIIGFGSITHDQSNGDPPNILETERLEGRIKSLVFSICLGHNGGEMTFGDWNKDLHLDKNKKLKNPKNNEDRVKVDDVKLHEDHRFILTDGLGDDPWRFQYKVPLMGIDFDGERIDYPYAKMNRGELNGEGAFFDTGTTYMYTSHEMFRKIKKRFNRFCNKESHNCGRDNTWKECYSIDDYQKRDMDKYFKSFPMFIFHFGQDREYRWYPSDYLIKNGDLDQYCVGIKPLKDMILGAVFMRNYDILFDKTRKLIGFARSDCKKTGKVHYYDENGKDLLIKIPQVIVSEKSASKEKSSNQGKYSNKHKHHKKGTKWETSAQNRKENHNQENDFMSFTAIVLLLTFFGIMFLVGKLLM